MMMFSMTFIWFHTGLKTFLRASPLLSRSHRGCRVRSLLGTVPHRATLVEFHQPVDRCDAQRLSVRPPSVGHPLLPQLSGQPHHLQPTLHTLQGVFPGAGMLPPGGQ